MQAVKLIIGGLFALTLMGGCGFLSYFFMTTSYLPAWLSVFVAVVCAIGALATFYLWINTSISFLRENSKKRVYHHGPK